MSGNTEAMTVRCKMQLSESTDLVYGGKRLKFTCVYDTTIEEDRRFNTATPWGEFTTVINNPTALAQFKLGAFYYIDFTPAA